MRLTATEPIDLLAPQGVHLRSTTLMQHQTVRQYNATCVAMHALRGPISTVEIRTALIRKGRSAGLRIGKGGGRLLLSDVVSDLLPAEFLQDAFGPGDRVAKVRGTSYYALDAVLCPGVNCSVAAVALALMLLYDSVEQALADCFGDACGQV